MFGVFASAQAQEPAPAGPVLVEPVLVGCAVPPLVGPGRAEVLLSLDVAGAVTAVAARSEPSAYLDALVAAASTCRFSPATEDGVPVPVDVPLTWEWAAPPPPPKQVPGPPDEAVGTYVTPPEPGTRYLVGEAVFRAMPGTMGDPVRALHVLPGVARTPLEAGWLLVRGGDPADTAAFVDGVRVPLLFHMGGLTSVLDPDLVGSVALLPGAFPAAYGGATAAVVDLQSRRVDGVPRAVGGLNLAWAHAYAEAPLAGGGFALAVRRSWLDAVLALVVGQDGAKAAPRFWDGSARWDRDHVGVMGLAVSDSIDVAEAGGTNATTITQRFAQVQGRVEADVAGGTFAVRPWVGTEARTIDATGRQETEQMRFPGARVEWSNDAVRFGLDGEYRAYTIDRDGTARSGTLAHADPYLQVATGDDVRVDLGGRLDTLFVAGQLPRFAPSPRGALAVRLGGGFTTSLDAAVLHHAPPELLLIGHPEGPYLPLEEAKHVGAALRYKSDDVSGVFEVWQRDTHDLTGWERDGSLGDLLARARGGDLDVTYEHDATTLRLGVTLMRSLRREETGDAWEPSRYEQPVFVQVLGARAVGDWLFSARFRAASGFPIDALTDPTAFDILTQSDVDLTPYLGGKAPPFLSGDLRAARTWTLRNAEVEAFLDVQNVNDRRVPEPAINGIDERNSVYALGLPILPIFGVETRWEKKRPAAP